ncbi:thiamine diphosphokinase [Fusobacterium naviforme]|nr:thiamine diphosphokinase [Fusobacterium naviforme]
MSLHCRKCSVCMKGRKRAEMAEQMAKKGIIIAGGSLTPAFAEKILAEEERRGTGALCLAAADAGLEVLDAIGRIPSLLVGDLDSLRPELLDRYENRKELELLRHNPVKDASDLELCIEVMAARGVRELTVLGALGGRADHLLANIRLCYSAALQNISLVLLDPLNRIRCVVPGESGEAVLKIRQAEQWGRYIGLLPVGGSVEGLTLMGFRYPLEHFTLSYETSPSRTISNELAEEEGIIRFQSRERSGLLVMETGDREEREV